MTGKQLKNAILQLAIQGKLVPQDANDEPASALLARIRKEKEQLLKAGKLKKKDLEITPIADDEKPFEIPESWEWVRLDNVTYSVGSKENQIQTKDILKIGNYCVVSQGQNLIDGYSNEDGKVVYDIPLVMFGDHTRNVKYVDFPFIIGADGTKFHKCILINAKYLFYWMLFVSQKLRNRGYARHYSLLKQETIPLPPLAEQHRIVAKIEELMPLVEEFGAAQEKLNRLNEALPEALKKSILQQAIQGKLVAQNPAEEPASALLARIRKEKEHLVKAGKLKKKDLETTPITDDEKPFEIPESWEWVRLKDVCTKIVDGDHNPPSGLSTKTEYLMISSKNVNFDRLVELDSVRYLSKEIFEIENQRTDAKVGDILFTSVGTLGRSCIIEQNNLNICFQRSVSIINTLTYNKYLKRCLDSPYIQFFVVENATGTAQKGFYLSQMEKLVIPLPPLAEQRRIVARVEELMELVEGMK